MFLMNGMKKGLLVFGFVIGSCFTNIHCSHRPTRQSQIVRNALFNQDGFNDRFQKIFIEHRSNKLPRYAMSVMQEDLSTLRKIVHKSKKELHVQKRLTKSEELFTKNNEELSLLKKHQKAIAKQKAFIDTLTDVLGQKETVARSITVFDKNALQKVPATVEKVYHFNKVVGQLYGNKDNFIENTDLTFAHNTLQMLQNDIDAHIDTIMPLLKKQ